MEMGGTSPPPGFRPPERELREKGRRRRGYTLPRGVNHVNRRNWDLATRDLPRPLAA